MKMGYAPSCENCASRNGCKLLVSNAKNCGYYMTKAEAERRMANAKRETAKNGK